MLYKTRNTNNNWNYFLLVNSVLLFCLSIVSNLMHAEGFQQFSLQATYLFQGSLQVLDLETFGLLDTTTNPSTGSTYWPLGLIPAVILLPFVYVASLFDVFFSQAFLVPILTIIAGFLVYQLARLLRFTKLNSIFLSIIFLFGTNLSLSVFIPQSWYFAHLISVVLCLLIILEKQLKNRPLVVGFLLACLLHTRYIAFLVMASFVFLSLLFGNKHKKKVTYQLSLSLPVVLSFTIFFTLNQIRFGNPFDTGYPKAQVEQDFLIQNRETYGYFSTRYLADNFYWYFLATPLPILNDQTQLLEFPYVKPSGMGISFFIVSPVFLLLIRSKIFMKKNTPILIPISLAIIILLLHYTPGYYTFGPRYLLDVLPLALLLLLQNLNDKDFGVKVKLLLIAGCWLNFYFIFTLYFL